MQLEKDSQVIPEEEEFQCPECGKAFPELVAVCPDCGAKFDGVEWEEEEGEEDEGDEVSFEEIEED